MGRVAKCAPGAACSGQYPANNIAADVREPEVPSTMSIGQLLVIQAQEMKDGGVKIVNMNLVLDDLYAVLIGSAVDNPWFNSRASHP